MANRLTFQAFYDPDAERLYLTLDAERNSIFEEDAEKLGMTLFKKGGYYWLPHPRTVAELDMLETVVTDLGYEYEYEERKDAVTGEVQDITGLGFDSLRRSPEAEKLGRDLIKDVHPHLATAKILFVTEDYEPKADRWGKVRWAYASKASQLAWWLEGWDFVITSCFQIWQQLNNAEKKALIDHELNHCTIVNGHWAIRPHDVEEFKDIISRHGDWGGNLQKLTTAKQAFDRTNKGKEEDAHPNIDRLKSSDEAPGV